MTEIGPDDLALVTTAEAAERAHVRSQLIREWARAGHLQPRRRDHHGRPLYALRDVYDAEHSTRTARRGRPRLDKTPTNSHTGRQQTTHPENEPGVTTCPPAPTTSSADSPPAPKRSAPPA